MNKVLQRGGTTMGEISRKIIVTAVLITSLIFHTSINITPLVHTVHAEGVVLPELPVAKLVPSRDLPLFKKGTKIDVYKISSEGYYLKDGRFIKKSPFIKIHYGIVKVSKSVKLRSGKHLKAGTYVVRETTNSSYVIDEGVLPKSDSTTFIVGTVDVIKRTMVENSKGLKRELKEINTYTVYSINNGVLNIKTKNLKYDKKDMEFTRY